MTIWGCIWLSSALSHNIMIILQSEGKHKVCYCFNGSLLTFSVTYWQRCRSWSPSGRISGSTMGTMPCWGQREAVSWQKTTALPLLIYDFLDVPTITELAKREPADFESSYATPVELLWENSILNSTFKSGGVLRCANKSLTIWQMLA